MTDHSPVRTRQIRTGAWTALSVFVAILLLLALSTIDNPDGTPWLESTLIGQTLALFGVVSAAVLPSLFAARKDAAVARDQLENTHVDAPNKISNVRDDLDHKHDAVMDAVEALAERMDRKFDGVYAEFRGARKDIGRATDQADRAATNADRLREKLETYEEKSNNRLDAIEGTLNGIATVTGTIPVVPEEET